VSYQYDIIKLLKMKLIFMCIDNLLKLSISNSKKKLNVHDQ